MPSTIGKCKLFKIKHTTLLEGEIFFKKQTQNCIFCNKVHIFLVEKKTPLVSVVKYALTTQSICPLLHTQISAVVYTLNKREIQISVYS